MLPVHVPQRHARGDISQASGKGSGRQLYINLGSANHGEQIETTAIFGMTNWAVKIIPIPNLQCRQLGRRYNQGTHNLADKNVRVDFEQPSDIRWRFKLNASRISEASALGSNLANCNPLSIRPQEKPPRRGRTGPDFSPLCFMKSGQWAALSYLLAGLLVSPNFQRCHFHDAPTIPMNTGTANHHQLVRSGFCPSTEFFLAGPSSPERLRRKAAASL